MKKYLEAMQVEEEQEEEKQQDVTTEESEDVLKRIRNGKAAGSNRAEYDKKDGRKAKL